MQTLAGQSEASKAATGQQNAPAIDLSDDVGPRAKRHRA